MDGERFCVPLDTKRVMRLRDVLPSQSHGSVLKKPNEAGSNIPAATCYLISDVDYNLDISAVLTLNVEIFGHVFVQTQVYDKSFFRVVASQHRNTESLSCAASELNLVLNPSFR